MSVADYIKKLLSEEEYSFSLDEIFKNTGKNNVSVKRELSRLAEKKEILNLRKSFWLIIPPRYAKFGKLPVQLYADKLFNYLQRKYYLGFYSAAKFNGAAHQQIQSDYIITTSPKFYDINKEPFDIKFFTAGRWPKENIIDKKADAGIFKISDPALTIIDLIHYQNKLGGLNRMLAIIEELTETLFEQQIIDLLKWYPVRSSLQRMGYILDMINDREHITDQIFEYLMEKPFFPVLLNPSSNRKPGAVNNRWKVDKNIEIESDL